MREEMKKYRIAIQCFCGQKIIVDADDLADLLGNIQFNLLGHIRNNHPEEMEKFKQKLKQSMLDTLNKIFDEYGEFFKGEDWKF
ncbi:MAG: hypothetical protein B6D53_01135 [Candidatus Omnitrophica bacterium 4484_49]|nr:hypothetical protein [Candidatus Omnitrophota bacterium]OQX83980.1 MAG: hypothetical protein B6D53_01135 [Candidatus Omnitrophica bacterium 4484_49]